MPSISAAIMIVLQDRIKCLAHAFFTPLTSNGRFAEVRFRIRIQGGGKATASRKHVFHFLIHRFIQTHLHLLETGMTGLLSAASFRSNIPSFRNIKGHCPHAMNSPACIGQSFYNRWILTTQYSLQVPPSNGCIDTGTLRQW